MILRRCTKKWPPRWKRPSARSAPSRKARATRKPPSSALADDCAAITQRLDRAEGYRGSQGGRLLALAPGAVFRRADNPANLKLLEDWMRSYKPEELFDAGGKLKPELKALAPKGNRRMSANPRANGGLLRKELKLPDFRSYAGESYPRHDRIREYETTRRISARRDEAEHDQLPRFRPRRDCLQPAPGGLRRKQENLDGRNAAGRRRWRRVIARRPRHGDAFRAHPAGLVGGISAHRAARILSHLRSLFRRHRFHVQPARQVARHLQEPRALARLGRLREHPAIVHRLASGPQWLFASGPRFHRPGHQQKRKCDASLFAA